MAASASCSAVASSSGRDLVSAIWRVEVGECGLACACADLQQRGVRLGERGGEGVGPRAGQRGAEQLGAHAGGERGDQQARVRILAPGVTTLTL